MIAPSNATVMPNFCDALFPFKLADSHVVIAMRLYNILLPWSRIYLVIFFKQKSC